MEQRADVVIIGAGIVGCSLADHLTQLGVRDVIVVEQGPLFATGGSTSHAPGLVFQTNASKTVTELAAYTVKHLSELDLDGEPCFYPAGSIEVASTPERWEDLKRKHGLATSWGVESQLIGPKQVREMIPLVDVSRIHGGFYVPSDGIAKPVRAGEAMARLAQERGARFYEHATVTDIDVRGGHVRAVETNRGRIETELVVSCAGMWGPRIARMVGVIFPLHPMQHQLVWTEPLPELAGQNEEVGHPLLRHQDRDLYFRQRRDHYGIGSYAHRVMPVSADDIPRHCESDVMPSVMPFTEEDFAQSWEDSCELLPPLRNTRIQEGLNGLFSFTVDGAPILGESRQVGGFWAAEAVWITHAGGVGKTVAEWIATGAPSIDLASCDIQRFEPHALAPSYIRTRASQNFVEVYDVIHPQQPMEEPRPLRTSPFYERQVELGAFFLEASGWERPHWYAANASLIDARDIPMRDDWAGRYWSPIVAAEAQVTRERVGLVDMTSLKRAEVTGPGALDFLQRLTTNQIDRPVGSVTYTLMLGHCGGIRSDITVARLGEHRFQIGLNGPRDLGWLERHSPDDGSVQVRDITPGTCCVGVWGPHARDLVQSLSDDDFSNKGFRFFRAKETHLAEVPVTALRLSYIGELGWEIYTTADMGRRLWGLLWEAGQPYGVIAAGRGAFNSMRLEKGYRSWGADMTTEHDPYEAGLEFAVKLDKGDFIGRDAVLERAERQPCRRLSCLTFDEPGMTIMGSEPVCHDGQAVGYVTSADYGYTVNKGIAYAYLPADLAAKGTRLEIQYFGQGYPVTVAREPLFDPEMKRMRA